MNYIKKKELKDLFSDKLFSFFEKKGFKLKRSDNRLVKTIKGGAFYIDYLVSDSYNVDRNEVAWNIEVIYFIRFDAVSEWFEPFEHRKKSDYKYAWTVGKKLTEITNSEFEIDVDEPNLEDKLEDILQKVIFGFDVFYNDNKSLVNVWKILMPNSISKDIDSIKNLKNFNVNTAIKYITIAWILKSDDFDAIVNICKLKMEELFKVGDPMAILYLPKLDDILSTLKSTDFSSSILILEGDK